MDYDTLFKTIKGYVENDFPSGTWTNPAGTGTVTLTSKEIIDTFIRQAEQRVYNTVQLLELRKTASLSCTSGNPIVNTPTDWLANFSLAVVLANGDYEFLLNKDPNFIRAAFPNPATTGTPTHYAFKDEDEFLLGPTPDSNYTLALTYFYYPTSIVDAGTSWLGDNFDSVLLYGSLLEAHTYVKGEEDVNANYKARYDEALALLKMLGEGKNRSDTYRSGQPRYPVR
jgi:hypothetical protein